MYICIIVADLSNPDVIYGTVGLGPLDGGGGGEKRVNDKESLKQLAVSQHYNRSTSQQKAGITICTNLTSNNQHFMIV